MRTPVLFFALPPVLASLFSSVRTAAASTAPFVSSFVPSGRPVGSARRSPTSTATAGRRGWGIVVPSAAAGTATVLLSSPLGDLFSGLTGSAPKSLDPPLDVLLSGTSIDPSDSRVDLRRVYKASVDGWSAIAFHKAVDGRGSALVAALSQSGKRFGGFNPLGWMSTDDYGGSNAAFLWFDRGGKAVKCPILLGGNAAIFDYATGGPCFGPADLKIGPPRAAVMGGFAGPDMEDTSVNAGDLRECSCSVGGAYDFVSGWPVRGKFRVVEVEVYCNGNIQPAGSSGGSGGFKLWPF